MKYRQYQVIEALKLKERTDQALDQFRMLKVITNLNDILISRQYLMSLDKYYLNLKLNEQQILILIKEAQIYDIAFIFKDIFLIKGQKKIQFELERRITNYIQTKDIRQFFLMDEILSSQNQIYQLIIQDLLIFLTNCYSHKFQFALIYDQMIKVSFLIINNRNILQSQEMLTWMDQIIDMASEKKDMYGWLVILDNIMSGIIQPEFGQFQPILVAQLWISKLYDLQRLFYYFGPYLVNQYHIDMNFVKNIIKYKASAQSIRFLSQICISLIIQQKTQILPQMQNIFHIFYGFFQDPQLIVNTMEFFHMYLQAPNMENSFVDEIVKNLKEARVNHDQNIQYKINYYLKTYQNTKEYDYREAPYYYKTGIKNIQNTCYFGSFMQVLFQSKQFVEKIKNEKNNSPFNRDDNIFESLSKMFCYLYYQNEVVDFYPIQQFRSIRNDYQLDIQHDVGEFILHFFEDLEKQHKQKYSTIKSLFVGTQQCNFKCQKCGRRKEGPEEDCLMLQLTIREQMSVQELIALLQGELITLDCECGLSQQFEKTINFVKTQQYLFLQLNRFKYDNGYKQKIFSFVKIDQEISIQKKVGIQNYKYYGMINHIGQSAEIGHYISYAVIQQSNFRFDDGHAREILEKPEKHFQPFETPYILCYKAV